MGRTYGSPSHPLPFRKEAEFTAPYGHPGSTPGGGVFLNILQYNNEFKLKTNLIFMKEVNDYSKFREYLRSLDGDKPFNCPLLAVLPEDVFYTGEGIYEFKKGELICIGKPGTLGPVSRTLLCSIQDGATVSLNSQNKLEVKARCSWNGSIFTLNVAGFEPKKV
ncbi:MAG: hypothetical protein AABW51_04660 [Nanoarchaeota archaeon]